LIFKKKKNKKVVGLKWVFKIKYNEDNNILKHKARIVATGCSEQHGVDFTETFMPITRIGNNQNNYCLICITSIAGFLT
jgi:plasmid replication initiation protein